MQLVANPLTETSHALAMKDRNWTSLVPLFPNEASPSYEDIVETLRDMDVAPHRQRAPVPLAHPPPFQRVTNHRSRCELRAHPMRRWINTKTPLSV